MLVSEVQSIVKNAEVVEGHLVALRDEVVQNGKRVLSLEVTFIGDVKDRIEVLEPRKSIDVDLVDPYWGDGGVCLGGLANVHSVMLGVYLVDGLGG